MIEQRMVVYAKLLYGDKLKLCEEEAIEWRRDLPKAIEVQHFLLGRGALHVPMTLASVRRLKTLGASNDK